MKKLLIFLLIILLSPTTHANTQTYFRIPTEFQNAVTLTDQGYIYKYSQLYTISTNIPANGFPIDIEYNQPIAQELELKKDIKTDLTKDLLLIDETISTQLNLYLEHKGKTQINYTAQPNQYTTITIYNMARTYNIMSLWTWQDTYGNTGTNWIYRGRILEPLTGIHVEQTIQPYTKE